MNQTTLSLAPAGTQLSVTRRWRMGLGEVDLLKWQSQREPWGTGASHLTDAVREQP